jgi:L,D-transpeptidase YcbB
MTYVKHTILLWFLLSIFSYACAQITNERLQQYVIGAEFSSLDLRYPEPVKQFYIQNQFKPVWLASDGINRINAMFELLRSAPDFGLNTNDYLPRHFAILGSYVSFLNNMYDSLRNEILLTDAIIHFFHDVKNGSQPVFGFEGLQYVPSTNEISSLFALGVNLNRFDTILSRLEPDCDVYRQIKMKLVYWNMIINEIDFQEVIIKSNVVSNNNSLLLIKLRQLGFIRIGESIDEKALIFKVKEAQRLFDLSNDGVLGRNTLSAFNVPLKSRRDELKLAINYLRWLNELKQRGKVALLNIPSAQLIIYNEGIMSFDSRIIVGKPSTPTKTLTSTIKEVIVYPYWNVPQSIAIKEILPHIKKSIVYLGKNNYQLLDKQGKVVDPYTINWHSVSATYFPYQIRQSTGCDNALGILKFNFYNPFSMYLHDTPSKNLFLLSSRFFSHGCMRVEKPVELARLLLQDKISSVETLINQCIEHQSPVTIQLENPLPLIVLYSTVWFNEKEEVIIYRDIYNKMSYHRSLSVKHQ